MVAPSRSISILRVVLFGLASVVRFAAFFLGVHRTISTKYSLPDVREEWGVESAYHSHR